MVTHKDMSFLLIGLVLSNLGNTYLGPVVGRWFPYDWTLLFAALYIAYFAIVTLRRCQARRNHEKQMTFIKQNKAEIKKILEQ